VKTEPTGKKPTEEDRYRRTLELFHDYNAAGLTSVCDRAAEPDAIDRYVKMRDAPRPHRASQRLAARRHDRLARRHPRPHRQIGQSPLRKDDPMLRLIGIKTFLDGGMLTGSAYMLEPWGVSKIYSITDPTYRGVLLIPENRLLPIARAAGEAGLQFHRPLRRRRCGPRAARRVRAIDRDLPPGALRATRPCVTHCNFVHPDDVPRFAKLGVSADIQPSGSTSTRARSSPVRRRALSRFQPLHDAVRRRRDRRRRVGPHAEDRPPPRDQPLRPLPRHGHRRHAHRRWYDGPLHPEHALTREQAVPMYTTNNAYLLLPRAPGRLAGSGQVRRLHRHRHRRAHLPAGEDRADEGARGRTWVGKGLFRPSAPIKTAPVLSATPGKWVACEPAPPRIRCSKFTSYILEGSRGGAALVLLALLPRREELTPTSARAFHAHG
jgi:hypothetical protein